MVQSVVTRFAKKLVLSGACCNSCILSVHFLGSFSMSYSNRTPFLVFGLDTGVSSSFFPALRHALIAS
jgi:hypothetical protein